MLRTNDTKNGTESAWLTQGHKKWQDWGTAFLDSYFSTEHTCVRVSIRVEQSSTQMLRATGKASTHTVVGVPGLTILTCRTCLDCTWAFGCWVFPLLLHRAGWQLCVTFWTPQDTFMPACHDLTPRLPAHPLTANNQGLPLLLSRIRLNFLFCLIIFISVL